MEKDGYFLIKSSKTCAGGKLKSPIISPPPICNFIDFESLKSERNTHRHVSRNSESESAAQTTRDRKAREYAVHERSYEYLQDL